MQKYCSILTHLELQIFAKYRKKCLLSVDCLSVLVPSFTFKLVPIPSLYHARKVHRRETHPRPAGGGTLSVKGRDREPF